MKELPTSSENLYHLNTYCRKRINYTILRVQSLMSELSLENNHESWKPESALDVLLVLLYCEGPTGKMGEMIEGITRLDKIMFLLSESEEFSSIIEQGYNFEADNFGPFAPELFDDIEALKQEKIINVITRSVPRRNIEVADELSVIDPLEDDNPSDTDFSVDKYQLTSEGFEVSKLIYNGLTEKQKNKLIQIKKRWQNRDLSDLLHYVYTKYPKTTEKSKIKRRILSK